MIQRCYIIDDERSGINILRDHIEKEGSLSISGVNTDPLAAIAEFERNGVPDLLFLDIDMPEMSGLALADLFPESHIIFCTSYREHAADAFDKEAVDYLLKPVSYDRFLKCIAKLKGHRTLKDNAFMIHAGSRGNLVKVVPGNISFIKGMLNYVEIHQANEKLITHMSLEEILAKLPPGIFSRVHRSYIINHRFIHKVLTGKLMLKDGIEVPIGKVFRKRFMEKINVK